MVATSTSQSTRIYLDDKEKQPAQLRVIQTGAEHPPCAWSSESLLHSRIQQKEEVMFSGKEKQNTQHQDKDL